VQCLAVGGELLGGGRLVCGAEDRRGGDEHDLAQLDDIKEELPLTLEVVSTPPSRRRWYRARGIPEAIRRAACWSSSHEPGLWA